MKMTEEEFLQDLRQDIISRAGAEENFTSTTFLDYMCSYLEEEAFISGYDLTEHKISSKGQAVDAWSYDEDLSKLTLIIGDYRPEASVESLTKTEIATLFARLQRFCQSALGDSFAESLEESDPTAKLAWHIREMKPHIASLSLVIVSNALLSTRVGELPQDKVGDYPTSYVVWDLGRLFRNASSGKSREGFEIDFSKMSCGPVDCLPASSGKQALESYLLVLPGKTLADLYDEYGERLLEQNVRTFLQFKGKINKGIKNTIVKEPHMFFCYNNGLSATAEDVVTSKDRTRILSVKNLQIVNGGQTTASIFTANRKERATLEEVFVQVKLTKIDQQDAEDVVPRISEYSNTQNRVNAADFFSNHPFHLRIEEFSRRIWAPSLEGSVHETHWFYERARGQFANQQSVMTTAQRKQFLLKNPRSQMFTKTDLAKYVLSFEEVPHEVSLGAQKAFAGSPRTKGFVGRISQKWEKDDRKINEVWFKRTIAKAILFKQLDKAVFKQDWYSGYKANIVTYTLAKFANMLRRSGKELHFLQIWEKQQVPDELLTHLLEIAEVVNDILCNPPAGVTSNVSEWAKKSGCWDAVEKYPIDLDRAIRALFIDPERKREADKEATQNQVIQTGIHAQEYVLEKGSEYWAQLRDWNQAAKKLTYKEVGILDVACAMPQKIPTDKQARILMKAEERAVEEGFYAKQPA